MGRWEPERLREEPPRDDEEGPGGGCGRPCRCEDLGRCGTAPSLLRRFPIPPPPEAGEPRGAERCGGSQAPPAAASRQRRRIPIQIRSWDSPGPPPPPPPARASGRHQLATGGGAALFGGGGGAGTP